MAGENISHSLTALDSKRGKIKIEVLDANYVGLDNEGVGNVCISGKAETAELINEGVGKIDATELDCEDVGFSNEGLGKVLTKKN